MLIPPSHRGDAASARAAYDEALVLLDAAHEERPDDFRIRMALGLVHAGLDRPDEAIRLGEEALAMYPMSKDAWAGPIVVRNMVLLLARAGANEAALEQIDYLLSFPNPGASRALFRIEPRLVKGSGLEMQHSYKDMPHVFIRMLHFKT